MLSVDQWQCFHSLHLFWDLFGSSLVYLLLPKENTGITKPGPAKDFKRWPKVAVSVINDRSFSVTVVNCFEWCCNLFQVH